VNDLIASPIDSNTSRRRKVPSKRRCKTATEYRYSDSRGFPRGRLRKKQLQSLILDQHGMQVPAGRAALPFLQTAAECCGNTLLHTGREVTAAAIVGALAIWCATWAPHADLTDIDKIADRAAKLGGWLPPDDHIGDRHHVTYAVRERLGFNAIGCWDVSIEEREDLALVRKRERERKRSAAKRAAQGCQPREQYLAQSLTSLRPWETEGISRRTWERRRKQERLGAAKHPVASPLPARVEVYGAMDLRHGKHRFGPLAPDGVGSAGLARCLWRERTDEGSSLGHVRIARCEFSAKSLPST
jgi:hypothetical protein